MSRAVKTAQAAPARTQRAPVGDGLENVISGFGTSRDKRTWSAYTLGQALERVTLEAMYRSSWLAGKIVDIVADDMTRGWLSFDCDEQHGQQQRAAIEDAQQRLGLRAKVNEALKWARLYGGAVLVLGMHDSVASAAAMAQPLDVEAVRLGDLCYLAVLDRWRVSAAAELVTDLHSSAFGLPAYYDIAESAVRVHHSRILRFNGNKLPYFAWTANARWDDSVLQRVYEKVRDADAVSGGIASMVFEANVDVLRFDGLAHMLAQQKGGEDCVRKRLDTALMGKSFTKALVLDQKDAYEKKSNNFAGLAQVMQQVMAEVCGAADIPMTRLYGQAAAGLNATGEGDARNYFDMVSAKQAAELRPQLETLYQVLVRSALGTMPGGFAWAFNSLWQMSEKDRAALELQRAQRDQIYVNLGALPEHVVTGDLLESGTYKNLTRQDVTLVKELGEAGALAVGDPAGPVLG